jgi:hypothetical protein
VKFCISKDPTYVCSGVFLFALTPTVVEAQTEMDGKRSSFDDTVGEHILTNPCQQTRINDSIHTNVVAYDEASRSPFIARRHAIVGLPSSFPEFQAPDRDLPDYSNLHT